MTSGGVNEELNAVDTVLDDPGPETLEKRRMARELSENPDLVKNIQDRFRQLFRQPAGEPPSSRPKFHIETIPDAKPPHKNPYRCTRFEEKELEEQLKKALSHKWIQPSNSEYALPCLFVPKKGGKHRMVIDFRPLNELTIKDRYPLPQIKDLIDKLGGAKLFSKIDLASGYHQFLVALEDRHKTAFTTKFGLYEWKVLPFGLANAPAVFMRYMNSIIEQRQGLKDFCVVYLDDILIFSNSEDEHREHVWAV